LLTTGDHFYVGIVVGACSQGRGGYAKYNGIAALILVPLPREPHPGSSGTLVNEYENDHSQGENEDPNADIRCGRGQEADLLVGDSDTVVKEC